MSWAVFVDFGTGDQEISQHCGKITRKRTAHKDLKSTVNFCTFEVYDKTIANQFNVATSDMPLTIEKDGATWFVGIIRPIFTTSIDSEFEKITIDGCDKGLMLQKQINQTLAYESYKVCDPSNKSTSIIHQLYYEAGIVDAELNLSLIDKTIDWFVVEKEDNTTYRKEIDDLLLEFGYIYDCRITGIFELIDIFPSSLSGTLVEDRDMYRNLTYTKREKAHEAVRVIWHPHVTLSDVLLFSDTTGGVSDGFCEITMGADSWYPTGSDTDNVYSKYELDGYEIIIVNNAALDWSFTGTVALNTWTPGNKRALVKFYSSVGGVITKFNITGDAVVRNLNDIRKSVRYNVASTDKIKEYQAKYITTAADAKKLSNGIADWYKYSNFVYTFETENSFDPGDIIELEEAVMSADITLRVIEVVEDEYGTVKITAEAISAYSLNDVDIESEITSPRANTAARLENERLVSKVEHQSGYTDTPSGGTITPTQVTINVCKAVAEHSILLAWDRQLNLTNFSHYEVQVSDDEVSWYSLKFDGTDWKDTLDATTDVLSEFLIHSGIPHTGTADNPSGKQLYYRVRRVTKVPTEGTWSATATATSNTIAAGDVAANSLYANNMIVGEIQTLFLRVADYVLVGYTGTGSWSSPDEGDRVNFIDLDEYTLYERTGGAWVVRQRIGGAIAGLFIAAFFGIMSCHPDNPPTSAEFFPGGDYRVFNFENNYEDHLGVDDWVLKINNALDTTYKKFGSYSFFATSENGSSLTSPSVGVIGSSQNIGGWVRPEKLTGSVDGGGFQVYGDSDNLISVTVKYSGGNAYINVYVKKGGTVTDETSTYYLTDAAWNYLAFSYDADSNTLYLVINNTIEIFEPSGTWGTGSAYVYVIAKNYAAGTFRIDECIFTFNQYITPNIWVQHYNHNVAWNTDYAYKDYSIRPAVGGRVFLDGPAKITGQLEISGASRVEATRSTAQTITDATPTKVQYSTEVVDNLSEYDNTTYYRFTPSLPVRESGTYEIDAAILTASVAWAAGDQVTLILYKNGVAYRNLYYWRSPASFTNYKAAHGTTKITLTSGDYIEIYAYIDRDGDTNLHNDAKYNYLTIHRLS